MELKWQPEIAAAVPQPMAALILRCCDEAPAMRPTIVEVGSSLSEFLQAPLGEEGGVATGMAAVDTWGTPRGA